MLKSSLPNQVTICWLYSTFLLHKLCSKKFCAHTSYFVKLTFEWVHATYFKSKLNCFFTPWEWILYFYHNLFLNVLISFWSYQLPVQEQFLRKKNLPLGPIEHVNSQVKWENILKVDYISFKHHIDVSWMWILKQISITYFNQNILPNIIYS